MRKHKFRSRHLIVRYRDFLHESGTIYHEKKLLYLNIQSAMASSILQGNKNGYGYISSNTKKRANLRAMQIYFSNCKPILVFIGMDVSQLSYE